MRRAPVLRSSIIALASIGTASCDDGIASKAAGLLGIYEITAWNQNEAGCSEEGPSIVAEQQESHFILTSESVLGTEFLALTLCTDLDDCDARARSGATLGGFGLTTGDAEAGFEGAGASAGTNFDTGRCQGEARDFRLQVVDADSLRLQIETTRVEDFPTGDEDVCWTDDARATAKTLPCTSLETITGRLVESRS